MNILFVCDEYPPGPHGGIGTVVQSLARAFVALGNKVVVAGLYDWGYGGADYETDQGVEVYRYRRPLDKGSIFTGKGRAVRIARGLFRRSHIPDRILHRHLPRFHRVLTELIHQHGIHIVEVPDYQDYVRYLRRPHAPQPLPAPTVVKLHGSLTYFAEELGKPVSRATRATERAILSAATSVASVSDYTARKTADYLDYSRPISVLYNGLEAKPAVSIPKTDNLVVFAGSLAYSKGIYQLMKAWPKVARAVPAAELHVYGKGPVDKVLNALDTTARARVHFRGHIPRENLQTAFAVASVAVFPSYAESFGLAALEAMAAGTAVVYSRRTCGPELITEGEDGLLIDPSDPTELSEAIIRLLQDHPLRARLAATGQASVLSKFSLDVVASNHLRFYERVIANSEGGRDAAPPDGALS